MGMFSRSKASIDAALKAIEGLEHNILPEDIKTHYKPEFEKELREIVNDLNVLLSDEEEINDVGYRKLLEQLDKLLGNYFDNYHQKKVVLPAGTSVPQLNSYLKSLAKVFKERYSFIYSNQYLRRLYLKRWDKKYGKKIELTGNAGLLKGPAIVAPTHHLMYEAPMLANLTNQWIFWVGDPGIWIKDYKISSFNLPVKRTFYKTMGIIRIDRTNMAEFRAPMLEKSLAVLEHGGLVGICPEAGIPADYERIKRLKIGSKGVIFLAQQAILHLGKDVPVIPIGIKESGEKIIIRIGEPWHIDPKGDGDYRLAMSTKLTEYIKSLAA